jgi:hypothetical protein
VEGRRNQEAEMQHPKASERSRVTPFAVLVPFLVGVISVTSLAAVNAERGLRPSDLAMPLALSLLIGLTAWVAAGLVAREPNGRGLVAGAAVGAVLFGGGVANWLPGVESAPLMALAVGVGLLAAPFALWRWVRPNAGPATFLRFLCLSGLLLLGFNLLSLRGLLWEPAGAPSHAGATGGEVETEALPDIYFILLDAYSGPRSLYDIYDLEITSFTDSLEALGFEVAYESHANYTATFLAMSAMLDWDYPDHILAGKTPSSRSRGPLYGLLHDNRTTRFLNELGYDVVFYRSSYPPLRWSRMAQLHLPEAAPRGEFEIRWLARTLLFTVGRAACDVVPCGKEGRPEFLPETASDHLAKFEMLAAAGADGAAPRFHYAHVMLPHEPFLFSHDCTPLGQSYWPSDISEENEHEIRQMYRDQVECVNRQVLLLVDGILSIGEPEPVIILQSDHGYARLEDARPRPLLEMSPDRVRERLDLFAAYHLPGDAGQITYPGITPVNAMRSVFREVFGLDLPPVEDRSFWSSFERPYDFTPIDVDALWEPERQTMRE